MTDPNSNNRELDAIEKVEKFAHQLEYNEITIDQSALKITLTNSLDGSQINLSELLFRDIDNYRTMKYEAGIRGTFAEICLKSVQRAYTYGVVKESTGLSRKIEVLETTNRQLKNEKEICENKLKRLSADHLQLLGRYDELNEKLNKSFKNQSGV